MSDAVLDSVFYSPVADWYRTRPFQVAFAVSVVGHAILIALIPGLRSVPIDTPMVLEVQIALPEAPQIPLSQETPLLAPNIERIPKPLIRQAQPQPKPEPVIRQPQ